MEEFLNNDYRRNMWYKSKDLISKISKVVEIERVVVLGSFMTKKERPADVDFMVMIKVSDDKNNEWSTDIAFVPSGSFGNASIEDCKLWMSEKYGEGNYTVMDLSLNEYLCV